MPTRVDNFQGWIKARDALEDSLAEAIDFKGLQAPSSDPNSPLQRTQRQIARLQDQIDRLVHVGFKLIDDAIAAEGLIQRLDGFARTAKHEAERLKNATKTLTAITKTVNKLVGIVDKIAGLPF